MKVKFITSIYSNLWGTDLGGRPSRKGHYRWSLLSLLKMTDADFLCYTSSEEIEELKNFFYVNHNISEDKLEFKVFDLRNTKFSNLINQIKDVEKTKKSDRCVEIQYSKFHWWWDEDKTYDYYYWIDAGLSHSGLIPNKYLEQTNHERRYYESSLFNNVFLNNLIKFTGDKFFMIGKENDKNYWSGTVDRKWYDQYDRKVHVIGGLFGGKKEIWDEIVTIFENYLEKLLPEDKRLYHEELIMSLMRVNHNDMFVLKEFDTWWCKDSGPKDLDDSYYDSRISFYQILEDLNHE